MGIENELDEGCLAIGRLERALSRAERAASALPRDGAGHFEDAGPLKREISAALSEIDALLSLNGRAPAMADLDLKVGGHHYRVACEEGQQADVRDLAATIDAEIMAMRGQAGNLGEARQLLYAALTLADRLKEAETLANPASASAQIDGNGEALIARLADRMEILADTLEKHSGTS